MLVVALATLVCYAITLVVGPASEAFGASLSLSTSQGTVAGGTMTVSVTGNADAGDLLFVEAAAPSAYITNTCSTGFPGFFTKLSSFSGDAVGPGQFSTSYSYAPETSGTWVLCGYLDKSDFETPDASFAGSFSVTERSGSLSITASPTRVAHNQPVTITASGTTNVATTLFLKASIAGLACSTISLASTSDLTPEHGDPIGVGSYSKSYAYTPTSGETSPTICGYLGSSSYSLINSFASGSGSFSISSEAKKHRAHKLRRKRRRPEQQKSPRSSQRKRLERCPNRFTDLWSTPRVTMGVAPAHRGTQTSTFPRPPLRTFTSRYRGMGIRLTTSSGANTSQPSPLLFAGAVIDRQHLPLRGHRTYQCRGGPNAEGCLSSRQRATVPLS